LNDPIARIVSSDGYDALLSHGCRHSITAGRSKSRPSPFPPDILNAHLQRHLADGEGLQLGGCSRLARTFSCAMGIVLTSQEYSADIEDDPRVPAATRPPLSGQSVYWSCKSPPMTPDPSASPSVQESPLSACLSRDSRVFSYATSYTTLPSPRDFADLGRGDVQGTIGSISEAALQSLAPRVAMMDVKHSCVGLDARSYPRLWYAEVCHHCLA
jgi:hypothetical protein